MRCLDPWTDRAEVRRIWLALVDVCTPTYFLSWGWIETWLDTLPRWVKLSLVVLDDEGAAWFVGRRVVLHGGIVPSRALYLNQTGWPELDDLTIEHNAWLARSPMTLDDVLANMPGSWDEVVMSAMDALPIPAGAVSREVSCHVVDLQKVRAARDYLALLGSSTRSQIRRAIKLYEDRGPVVVEAVETTPAALAAFDELVGLHAAAWRSRGEPSVFSGYLYDFHRRLVAKRFAHGEIQLLRVRAGTTTIGSLYNFVYGGVVSYYQSGFAYEVDNKLKPGLVCHALAIAHNATAGHAIYDFLGSDARYKRSLATDAQRLTWLTIRKPRRRFAVAEAARTWMRRFTRRA